MSQLRPENHLHLDSAWASQLKVALIVARFNSVITQAMKNSALQTFAEFGLSPQNCTVIEVAGAYEIPFMALKAKEHLNVDGILALGAVIRGDTPHFDYVCQGVTNGCMSAQLQMDCPISFGVITVNTLKQAKERSGKNDQNKGRETALALLETLVTAESLKPIQKKRRKK